MYIWLLVDLPLWKMMEFVSWDDEIPNMMAAIGILLGTTTSVLRTSAWPRNCRWSQKKTCGMRMNATPPHRWLNHVCKLNSMFIDKQKGGAVTFCSKISKYQLVECRNAHSSWSNHVKPLYTADLPNFTGQDTEKIETSGESVDYARPDRRTQTWAVLLCALTLNQRQIGTSGWFWGVYVSMLAGMVWCWCSVLSPCFHGYIPTCCAMSNC
jgi:hypothetical protein